MAHVNKHVAVAMLLMTWSYTVVSAQSDCVRFRKGGVYETTVGDSYHVATADLNGDSNVDFVVSGTFGFVAVFYGDGTGHFSGPATFPAGQYPFDVTVGDFNGDGLPDLAVADQANGGTPGAQVLLNNGDGTFAAPVFYPTVGGPRLVVTADFNQDGNLDLALADDSDLNVLLGNGDGTFQPTITSSGPDLPGGITLGDFNEDGNVDLAISNYTSKDLRILLGDGQGHFTIAFTYSLSGNAAEVARGDFNKDGHQDLAVSVFNATPNNHISVYFGNGDGSFTAGPEILVSDPQGIVAADFNNDGDLDLAVVSPFVRQHLLVVALGDGMGNFPVVQSFPTQRGSGDPRDLAVANFDGNGRKDVVTAQGSSNIFLNVPCR
jgi:hypothetical protein